MKNQRVPLAMTVFVDLNNNKPSASLNHQYDILNIPDAQLCTIWTSHLYHSINQVLLLLLTRKQTFQGTILSITPPISSTCFPWEQGASLSPDLSLRTRTPRHQRRCSGPAESWFHQVLQLYKKATFRCLRDHRQRPFIQPWPSTMWPETQHT